MAKDEIAAFLGAGTIYDGKLSFTASVRIDGQFTGEITSEGTLILGRDAMVEGTIQVGRLELSGSLRGDVTVTGETVMLKSANLVGNLVTRTLIMESGALLQGTISMDPAQAGLAKGSIAADLTERGARDIEIQ